VTAPASQRLVDHLAGVLERRTSRRGFLARTAIVGSALAVAPAEYILRPVSAYAAACGCSGQGCACGSACCDGYTEFCCTINQGANTCPAGSFVGGWWKADGSVYCSGARYYIDCMAMCTGCGCSGGHFCSPACDGLTCRCANGNCNLRKVGCISFRYGQCHQEIACSGRIACRVVTCTPPWMVDPTCTTTVLVDDNTANHDAPCLQEPTVDFGSYGVAVRAQGGYYAVAADGGVFAEGGAPFFGSMGGQVLRAPVLGIAATATGGGYWLVAADGGVFAFGDAPYLGSMGGSYLNGPIIAMAATPTGKGYWLLGRDGGLFCFGDAAFHGSTGAMSLNAPIVGMAPTPTGRGYWLVGSDGGIFCFGDAAFHGSTGDLKLNRPIAGLFPTPSGGGYYLLARDGGVDAFGDAPFFGSYPGLPGDEQTLPPLQSGAFFSLLVKMTGAHVSGYTIYAVSAPAPPPAVASWAFGS